jgi:hypothetical protein
MLICPSVCQHVTLKMQSRFSWYFTLVNFTEICRYPDFGLNRTKMTCTFMAIYFRTCAWNWHWNGIGNPQLEITATQRTLTAGNWRQCVIRIGQRSFVDEPHSLQHRKEHSQTEYLEAETTKGPYCEVKSSFPNLFIQPTLVWNMLTLIIARKKIPHAKFHEKLSTGLSYEITKIVI